MKASNNLICFILLSICLFLASCHTGLGSRFEKKNTLVHSLNYNELELSSYPFKIYAAVPQGQVGTKAIVVIEGDGYAFSSRYRVSANPTPTDPVGLRIVHKSTANAIYLARPCQYVWQENCSETYWSSRRYSREVLLSYDDALNQLKNRYMIEKFHLVGFSGGAYISLMLAAVRDDIQRVDTVAGLLDPQSWVAFHDISPLELEYSVTDLLLRSKQVEFYHLCSEKDKVVPCELHRAFINKARQHGLYNHRLELDMGSKHSNLWERYTLRP